MTVVLAVDPSIASPGAALFRDRVLVVAIRSTLPSIPDEGRGARVERVARRLYTAPPGGVDVLVYEWPQVYRASKAKGDPNDLIALAAVGAALAGMLCPRVIVTPTPAEWTGGLPKVTKGDPWRSPRGRRIASRLSPAERALVPDSHDAIDSVGLGLWYLGRLDPVRVFPGAT